MAEEKERMPVGEGLPEMPEEIRLAPVRVRINWRRIVFIMIGAGLFALFYLVETLPDAVDPAGKVFKLSWEGKLAIGLFLMAGVWWVFEVMPIGATSIAIGVVQTLFWIRPAKQALGDF
ncbi:MAG: SLC13/DASS family transporter, partial [Deltaproteobacteria bacterium]|nr:SLC13/DASS family transporter [Deltaproteobacteria bacterium]MBW2135851.1 SLC13/DASS family transporter [Deltaproteobacteria bacterium]